MVDTIWRIERGDGPLVATAIHDGHQVREEIAPLLALSAADRLREEDPFTAEWTSVAPTRIVGLRSRFEVDLNRPRERAVYLAPEDAWGLQVWREPPPPEAITRSLEAYDAFYTKVEDSFRELATQVGPFLVLDLHSYNHRRGGTGAPTADPVANPQVNVGTGTMPDRHRWARVVDAFMSELAAFDFPGGRLDVRENVRFRGGAFPAWIHRTFPETACVLSIEFKKVFMDEWTGEPDPPLVEAIREALGSALPTALQELTGS
jgi:N-formylglutamate deformylase